MTGNTRFAASVHMLAYLACHHGAAVRSAEIVTRVDTHPVVIRRLLSALVKAGCHAPIRSCRSDLRFLASVGWIESSIVTSGEFPWIALAVAAKLHLDGF